MRERRVEGRDERLDVLLSGGGISRSRAAELIRAGHASVNGKREDKPSFRVKEGDSVLLRQPDAVETAAQAENLPLTILYQDGDVAVVYKPEGMVVHPASGNESGTLVNALLFHLEGLSGIGGQMRPGIVHRLDKDTSGILLVAKNDAAHISLSRQLAERQMEKHYYAVVAGVMKEESGTVDAPIGRSDRDRKKMAVREDGRSAVTKWRVVWQEKDRALLDVHLITGRTHQIRVHMAYLHHPVLGDPLYGNRSAPPAARLMLHAFSISFTHPSTGERLTFTAPPAALFKAPGQ